jgi:branched-chain amino acid transport system substrate-binding protein
VDRYKKRFQSEPSVFAAQAYDATSVVLEAIRKGATSGSEVRDYLVNQPELAALSGPARFDGTGTLNRRVFVLGVKQRKLVQLE